MEEHLTLAIPNINLEPKESLTKAKRKKCLNIKFTKGFSGAIKNGTTKYDHKTNLKPQTMTNHNNAKRKVQNKKNKST